jgi:hypothetical protein
MKSNGIMLEEARAMLARTPGSLRGLLEGLPDALARANEGSDTWSAYDVIGHLIHAERANWIYRARHILAAETRPFEPFDSTGQFEESQGKSMAELLANFSRLRGDSLAALDGLNISPADLGRHGLHPELGDVTLGQLLATWVVHDLDHVAQVTRTLAKAYSEATGPWSKFLSILRDRQSQ